MKQLIVVVGFFDEKARSFYESVQGVIDVTSTNVRFSWNINVKAIWMIDATKAEVRATVNLLVNPTKFGIWVLARLID